jgi:hypothetical protein
MSSRDRELRENATTESRPVTDRPSVWLVPMSLLLATSVLAAGVISLALIWRRSTEEPPKPITQTSMGDGTAIQLLAVTAGRRHKFDVGSFYGWDRKQMGIAACTPSETTQEDAMLLWLARHDEETDRAHKFDWWSHSIAEAECEVLDQAARTVIVPSIRD